LPSNASLYDKLNFDFVRDFAPVAGIMRVPNVMEVHPSVPAKTVNPPGGTAQNRFWAPLLPGAPSNCTDLRCRTCQGDETHQRAPQNHGGTSGEPTDRTQE
jgi:hypothetical protein